MMRREGDADDDAENAEEERQAGAKGFRKLFDTWPHNFSHCSRPSYIDAFSLHVLQHCNTVSESSPLLREGGLDVVDGGVQLRGAARLVWVVVAQQHRARGSPLPGLPPRHQGRAVDARHPD